MWPHQDTQRDYHGDPCGVSYRLFGAVFHKGASLHTGRYYATIRASAGTISDARGRSRSPSSGRNRYDSSETSPAFE